jgi:hypothetical protein
MPDPAVCPNCSAVYCEGRWQWIAEPAGAQREPCPACRRIKDELPAGIVTMTSPALARLKEEIIRLARNQEEAERIEHPLNRIMSIDEAAPDQIVISTTDIHLPRRIGEALRRAFHGNLKIHFDEQGYFVRVNWHLDA